MYDFDTDEVLYLASTYLETYYSKNRNIVDLDTSEIENYIKLVHDNTEVIEEALDPGSMVMYEGSYYDISLETELSDLIEYLGLWENVECFAGDLVDDKREDIIEDFYIDEVDENGDIIEDGETYLDEDGLEAYLKDYIRSKEASEEIAEYIQKQIINSELETPNTTNLYYRIGDVPITNENEESHLVRGIWIKLAIRGDYTLQGFYINRDTYTTAELKAQYMHSHVPIIYDSIYIQNASISWGSPCLGYGIVSDYVNLLNAEASPSDYLNLILYIEDYIKTESLTGVPYIRASAVNSYKQTYITLPSFYRNYFLTQNLNRKLLSTYYTEFNTDICSPNNPYFVAYVLTNNPDLLICSNKEVRFSMNLFNVWSLMSNAYLEYLDAYFPDTNDVNFNIFLRRYYITPDFEIKYINGELDLNEEAKANIKVGDKIIPITTVKESDLIEGDVLIDIRHFVSIIDYITSIVE